jgi:hypothetical protein
VDCGTDWEGRKLKPMASLKAHFDGRSIVPDEPATLMNGDE